MIKFIVVAATLLSTTSCGNTKEALDGLSVAVDGYCECIAKVGALPTEAIVSVDLLELEKQQCGLTLDAVKVAQAEIKDHNAADVLAIRKRQQVCFYTIRDLHKQAKTSSP